MAVTYRLLIKIFKKSCYYTVWTSIEIGFHIHVYYYISSRDITGLNKSDIFTSYYFESVRLLKVL